MTIEDINKKVIRDLLAEMDKGNIDAAMVYYSSGFIDHNTESLRGGVQDLKTIKKVFEIFMEAFPDASHIINDIIAEGDLVAARITFQGTFVKSLFNYSPTGKKIEAQGLTIYRLDNKKIMEKWGGVNVLKILGISTNDKIVNENIK